MSEHTDNLRRALLELQPIGATGFEGLLAATLTAITGIPFRLAGSGSQFGVDGKAAYPDDGVCFEGKRYDGSIPRSEVLSKLAEVAVRDDGGVDLWVLGATTTVGSQLGDDVRKLGDREGIATLILDWSEHGLPPLAVALAMARESSGDFFNRHIADGDVAARGLAALGEIQKTEGFEEHAERLHTDLHDPTTGVGLARQANTDWLTGVFSDKRSATRFLGQPLCPGDQSEGESAQRSALVGRLTSSMTGRPDGATVVISGGEGNGKSWLVAQSWLSLTDRPLLAFLTADDFTESSVTRSHTELLIEKLIEQTTSRLAETTRNRWRRRIGRWRKASTPDSPRLVVVVDGLNQRPNADWGRIIDALGSDLAQIGGRLFVTSRAEYYRQHVKPRLISATIVIEVPEWTGAERNAILSARGISGIRLQPAVAASLRNPRMLGIALELLQRADIEALEELSPSRLLFEHIRTQERDAFSPRPAGEFARALQDHAAEILTRLNAEQLEDLTIFDGGLSAVADGRFFFPVDGDPTLYRLGEDGLTLSLGFAVLDELRRAHRNDRDLGDALEQMVEPLGALDLMAEVIFAGLTVACLDGKCPEEIRPILVMALARVQNPNTGHFPAFAALAKQRPEPFLHAAERVCLESARPPNFDWIEAALHAAKADDRAWSLMSPRISSWLCYYSLSPDERLVSHMRSSAEKLEEERAKKQSEIEAKLAALSASERAVLATLTHSDTGDLATLARLAFALMAGMPIAPFATELAGWCFLYRVERLERHALQGIRASCRVQSYRLVRGPQCDSERVPSIRRS